MTYSVFPNQETIKKFKVKLTNGEQALLNYLTTLFNRPGYRERDFEIHVQSNLFFGKPDFIVIEPGYSVWIIEVKDYRRGSYQIEFQDNSNEDSWWLYDQTAIPSPIQQVEDYKQKFIEYAGPSVSNGIGQGGKKYGLGIRTAVFFYHLLPEDFQGKPDNTTLIFPSNFINVQSDNVVRDFFEQTWKENLRLSKDECQEIRSIIDPGENGQNMPLPDFKGKYGRLCQSEDGRKKIRGIAGTGKTSVLAKRVVNASKRFPHGEILVTCYNITMCNYLQDKIVAEGRKSLNELGIRVQHFHSLYSWKKISDKEYVMNGKSEDNRYDALFIDEGQDFKREWFDCLIQDYLMESTREFVIFADENQNIYDRGTIVDEDEFAKPKKLPNTPIKGRWTVLNEVYRTSSNEILSLINRFSREMLQDENTPLDVQLSLLEEVGEQTVFYSDLTQFADYHMRYQQVIQAVDTYTNDFIRHGAAINDIAILSTDKAFLREVEFQLRNRIQPNNFFWETITTFKPKQNAQEKETGEDSREDRPYKYRFYRNNGPIKFSTVHSFKGWETPYVILILPPTKREDLVYNYLVYTGLSRAKNKLAILNLNSGYTDLLQKKHPIQTSVEERSSLLQLIDEGYLDDDYDANQGFWHTCPACGSYLGEGVCQSCGSFDWDSYQDND